MPKTNLFHEPDPADSYGVQAPAHALPQRVSSFPLSKPRKMELITEILVVVDSIAANFDYNEFGLPLHDDETMDKMSAAVETVLDKFF